MEHSHSQIIALPIIPHHVELEIDNARTYFQSKGRCIFCDILKHDIADASRLIDCSSEYAVLAPYAPKYPYETWIVPQTHSSNFENIDDFQVSFAFSCPHLLVHVCIVMGTRPAQEHVVELCAVIYTVSSFEVCLCAFIVAVFQH